jgi:hypothetical protein
MKPNGWDMALRVLCCGSFVLLGWSLRGNLAAKSAPGARDANRPAARDANPPADRLTFAAKLAPAASPPGPATLPSGRANITAEAAALGRDPSLASQASVADLSKGAVKGDVSHADR